MTKLRVGVAGAAGFTGGELVRILLQHPRFELVQAASNSHAGEPLHSAHPHLRGLSALSFLPAAEPEGLDALFLAGGHGEAMELAPALLQKAPGLKLVDLSGDFRLRDAALYPLWYGRRHAAPALLGRFAYGLPELDAAAVRGAGLVSNPGCIATAAALSLGPLAKAGVKATAAVTAITGSSGSGVKPSATTHHPLREGNVRAYKPLSHQHAPEVEQLLGRLGGEIGLALTAVSGPFVRGIYSVTNLELSSDWTDARLRSAFEDAYEGAAFVRLLDAPPELNAVTGSNHCDIHVRMEGRRAVVIAALDNLVKGAAGQAVQNLNLMLGFDEAEGLRFPGIYP
ncbi:MAG: N-acetyl-gamma-glutamyl-phosphate reductase [Elusimicrobia bacterium]|nr:N-acetyl-gamma-glutamyl-phosphate reductase [Elusimicrobiota bacterium]